MDRKSWIFIGICILALGVGFHGLATETGPVGWLDAVQQQLLGSYHQFFSFMIVIIGVLVAGLVLWHWADKLLGRDRIAPPAPPPAAPPGPVAPARPASPGRTLFIVALAVIAATWVIGGALYGWRVLTLRRDASAVYQPVELLDGKALPPLAHKHLALRCVPVPELAVVFRSGSVEDYRLVAVVGTGWDLDHPVPVVARLEPSQTLDQGSGTAGGLVQVQLLARRLGAVPLPALAEFRKMRAPLADGVIMVTPVAARDGRPYLPDTGVDLVVTAIICGCINLATVLWAAVRWLRRRPAAGKA